jgi:polar amino acid transport system substrate-binding protein
MWRISLSTIQSGWQKTEKEKGKYDFSWLDEQVDNLLKRGLKPWLCLCYGNQIYDDFAKERFPNAKREYYNMISDMIVAVEQEKIDGYLSESTYVTAAIWEGAKIQSIDEAIDHTQAAYIFQKSEQSAQLREQLNSFIRAAKENGTLDELEEKWFGKTEPTGKLDFNSLTGENGTIRIAVAPDLKPISYIKDGELTGYEMEILLLFAKEYGYKLDMSYMTFDAILPGVTTGKYDIGTGAITITEERAQSVDFSESHLTVDVVMVAVRRRPRRWFRPLSGAM